MAHKSYVTLEEVVAAEGYASPAAALRHQRATEKRHRELADFRDEVITAAGRAPKASIRAIGS